MALAAAVAGAGGLGFLAAGYKDATAVGEEIAQLRQATGGPWGLNVFAPPGPAPQPGVVAGYAAELAGLAASTGAELGEPRHDDDSWAEKLELAIATAPPVVSFTFGCPDDVQIAALREAGSAVWVTVTTPAEAATAAAAGADALVVQGVEAGGHRGSFDDADPADYGLLALLQLARARTPLPLVATGGIATGAAIAGVLAAGAAAAQLGTAFLLCPEAGTAPAHRERLGGDAPTGLTRAFTGRTARGVVNRMQAEHPDAPSGYPDIHHLTAPLRAAARWAGNGDAINLWAGQAHALAEPEPAGSLVTRLAADVRQALRAV